jgi:cytochrome c oxidase assembly protein subunit 15
MTDTPADAAPAPLPRPTRAIALWLGLCAAMVFAMVVIGGITRLTESGLSIVEWRPVTGIIPPVSEGRWQAEFAKYQATPEFKRVNFTMTLAEFKQIYWWEYVHRLWGRLIGIVFAVPFLWFLIRGRIPGRLILPLIGLFVLGGLQGALGWWMVKSGLVDTPAVSQYRLAAHLGLAVVIYAALVWLTLSTWQPAHRAPNAFQASEPEPPPPPRYGAGAHALGAFLVLLVFTTLIAGAFVAGLDAGMVYNTFPLMEGRLVPELYWAMEPRWANLFENAAAVQFNHRALATLTLVSCLLSCMLVRYPAFGWAALLACIQFGLGIATLLLQVPVVLGALHQAGAMALFTACVWAAHGPGRARRIAWSAPPVLPAPVQGEAVDLMAGIGAERPRVP